VQPRRAQDWLALSPAYYGRPAAEETINDPTNPRHYWRWRMAPTVEELLSDRNLLSVIHHLHIVSGRASPDDLAAAAAPATAVAATL
jgi:4-alpha-glucanotransferase